MTSWFLLITTKLKSGPFITAYGFLVEFEGGIFLDLIV